MSFVLIRFLIYAIAIPTSLATFLGFLGTLDWRLELLDHPRPQYCLILIIALTLTLLDRRPKFSLAFAIPLLLNLAPIAPLFLPTSHPAASDPLRLLQVNLDRHNPTPARAIDYLDRQTADFIFLQEVTPTWGHQLRSQLQRYRVLSAIARPDSQGIALLVPKPRSRSAEILTIQVIHLPERSRRPLLQLTVRWHSTDIAILSLHVTRSRNAGTSAWQQAEFEAAATWSAQQQRDREVVVLGDFNSTPWSQRFRRFQASARLHDSHRGFGWQPTWNANWLPLARIPIDLCLHSDGLATVGRRIGSPLGSDHLPLFVELARSP
jgi:endonuclease/exonuclease/phosphatase (EEP) superfamily protein YafD